MLFYFGLYVKIKAKEKHPEIELPPPPKKKKSSLFVGGDIGSCTPCSQRIRINRCLSLKGMWCDSRPWLKDAEVVGDSQGCRGTKGKSSHQS